MSSTTSVKLLIHLLRIAFNTFPPPFGNSRKQPDYCILPQGQNLPTIVVETGWSESFLRLRDDMRLWLISGAGALQLVMLFNWSKLTGGRIKGVVEVHNLDPAGNCRLNQTKVVANMSTVVRSEHTRLMADKSSLFFPHRSRPLQL